MKVNKKRIIYLILSLIFLFFLISVLFIYYNNYMDNQVDKKVKETFYEKEEEVELNERFLPLLEINEDVIGWLKIPGTNIDYPVLKTDNNDFYLDHNIEREKAKNGAIFMDFRNKGDLTDRHTIIYGHHTKEKTKFTELMSYKDKDFFYNNNIIIYSTLYEETKWEIFSAYVTSTEFYYIVTDFKNDSNYLSFINKFKDKSKFKTNVVLDTNDKVMTLSTCTYEFKDARFVVHARKIGIN